MADTRRTFSALAILFADNTAGAISAQDLRDFLKSMQVHTSSSAPTATDDETSGFDVGHEWLETTTPAIYRCLDASTGAAVWEQTWPATVSTLDADAVTYENSTSGLTADDVQAALDEIVAGLGGGGSGIPAANGLVVVQHGATAATSRPTAAVVYWMGSVAPDNKTTGDIWLETGAFD